MSVESLALARPARRVLVRQFRSPLVLLLVFAAAIAAIVGEWTDALVVGAIVIASLGIGFHREYHAETAIAKLLARIELTALVLRDGTWRTLPVRELVVGDIVRLAAGSLVPADGELIEATALHIDEAAMTGESYPVEKPRGPVFFGTNVRSGTGQMRVRAIGDDTKFGGLVRSLAARPPETEFERGLRRFGMLLVGSMVVILVGVFAIDVMLGRPFVDTLLFAIALAVGLSPELLPAIIGVNLSHAAQVLAGGGLLCRRLAAIENLGSMTVLCTDKTGTLTEGVARIEGAYDRDGVRSERVMQLALVNAALQTGLANPIDAALLAAGAPDTAGIAKRRELPYDFMRKRLSVIVERDGRLEIITKGAFDHVVEICRTTPDELLRLRKLYEGWCEEGIRVIAVATGSGDAEHDLAFAASSR